MSIAPDSHYWLRGGRRVDRNSPTASGSRTEGRALAWRYISSDCTSDDARLRRAYMELHPADRAQLLKRRAQELSERADPSSVSEPSLDAASRLAPADPDHRPDPDHRRPPQLPCSN